MDNTDRYRDLRSLDRGGNPGGSYKFVAYFKEELIPFMEKHFRIADYHILVGPQANAYFGLYSLIENPDLFDAFILENSFQNPPKVNEYLLDKANSYFDKGRILNKFLFMIVLKKKPQLSAGTYAENNSRIKYSDRITIRFQRN